MNQVGAHSRTVLTRQVQPMQQRIGWMMIRSFNGPQAVALNQQRQHIEHFALLTAQRFKEGALIRTERMLTARAIQTVFTVTVNFDIASLNFTKLTTRALSAPLLFEIHRASPPGYYDKSGDADRLTHNRFHGLDIQPAIFTAYIYSTRIGRMLN